VGYVQHGLVPVEGLLSLHLCYVIIRFRSIILLTIKDLLLLYQNIE